MKIISLNVRGFGYGNRVDKFGWVKRLILKEKPIFVALQETKMGSVDLNWIGRLWGSYDCDFVQKEKIGKAGGQLFIWDSNLFEAKTVIRLDYVIGIKGVWKSSGCNINVANVYGPCDDVNKQKLWNALFNLISANDEEWVLCDDFNEVRNQLERFNCEFLEYRADRFNKFIADSRLMEIPLGGRNFTRVSDDGLKYSKLDRFLVTEKFYNLWKDLTVVELDRDLLDHCPIMLKDEERNFGPKPFKVFDVWFDEEDVSDVICDAWNVAVPDINRKDCVFRNKLKNVKNALKAWSRSKFNNLDGEIDLFKTTVQQLELQAESRVLTDVELELWRKSRKQWLEKERIKTNMLKQKARVKWILDGDENTKYFHSVIRRRNNSNTIRGLTINGPEQSAFLKGHFILDGALIVNESIDFLKNNRKKGLVFKVDFEKAFDCLNWDFLMEVVNSMGFGCKWRKWIYSCLSSASISILVNGSPTKEFSLERGVRQGDPLSPFLFILAAEGLNIMTKAATDRGLFKGI
ncbi:uncharacterized protein [Rutidosis leptorrhynchoides]|uniref:uncharacterized protein n=1 Tax=Rutidosis leptorrhynchoides TaxID=125765 RepID=UPI003A993C35